MIFAREKSTCINSMEINESFSFRYDFDKREKNICVNCSGMNAMFDISYNFRLSVKFLTHLINNTREKLGYSCTSHFRLIVVPVYLLAIKQVLFTLT